jgi:hypothetical protein
MAVAQQQPGGSTGRPRATICCSPPPFCSRLKPREASRSIAAAERRPERQYTTMSRSRYGASSCQRSSNWFSGMWTVPATWPAAYSSAVRTSRKTGADCGAAARPACGATAVPPCASPCAGAPAGESLRAHPLNMRNAAIAGIVTCMITRPSVDEATAHGNGAASGRTGGHPGRRGGGPTVEAVAGEDVRCGEVQRQRGEGRGIRDLVRRSDVSAGLGARGSPGAHHWSRRHCAFHATAAVWCAALQNASRSFIVAIVCNRHPETTPVFRGTRRPEPASLPDRKEPCVHCVSRCVPQPGRTVGGGAPIRIPGECR